DEVLAISEKVVLRVEDLLDRIVDDAGWCRGLEAIWEKDCYLEASKEEAKSPAKMLIDSALDFEDVIKEKEQIAEEMYAEGSGVVVLSFPRYCRYRGIVKRLEGVANKWLRNTLVIALGGFAVPCRNTRILFCKDTFDYPDLEGHELLCNHLAPNLKGRPQRKRKKRSLSPAGSESNESEESSVSTVSSTVKAKPTGSGGGRNGLRCNNLVVTRRRTRATPSPEEREFLINLHRFMKLRQTPIGRVPHLGFKEIDLFAFYNKVQKLGGYNVVTANRMWKPIYDELGGHQGSTSAATCTRRHYERLLLPFERSIKNEEVKERRRNKALRVFTIPVSKNKERTSSLRSVRTKADKSLQETQRPKDKENIPVSNVSEVEVKQQESSSESSASEKTPELIDLVSSEQETPVKVVRTSPVPALKKRKLEILKEGGLEVTAITPSTMAPTTSIGSITITADRRPSVIQHTAPVVQGQVSITVTPDVSHMLGSPPTESNSAASTPSPTAGCDPTGLQRSFSVQDLKHPALQHLYTGSLSQAHSSTPSPSSSTPDEWTPPRVTQSRSMYSHSESTVYGNPKDVYGQKDIYSNNAFSKQKETFALIKEVYGNQKDSNEAPPGLLYRRRSYVKPVASSSEVLDLTVNNSRKPAVSISRVTSASARNPIRSTPKTNGVTPFPIIDGRAVVGSNLEITVVDVPKSTPSLQQKQQQLLQQNRAVQQQQQQRRSLSIKPAPVGRPVSRNENGRHNALSITQIPPHRNSSNPPLVIPNPFLNSSGSSTRKNVPNESSRSRPAPPSSHSATSSSGSMPFLPTNSPVFPGYLSQMAPASGGSGGSANSKNASPFLPLIDPMYYPALYGSHGIYPPNVAAGFLSPLQVATAQPLFAEQLQLYKDLMSRHRFSQAAGSYLGLPRDGSTSITPVGQPTPTTK
ncbi:hypothetical protein L9F63_020602, partial [Diploptera punctata]